ncbi:MAG: TerB family tellurite resistance protein [Bacteroidaceae bacterium]|nr:TerB family tellurite resistance protein [Bacteroidaceae bacterium]
MNTDIKHIAALVATSIWADGEYDAAEKIVVEEIADAFELNAEDLSAAVEQELEVIKPMSEDEVNAYILEHSAEVEDEEAEMLLQAVLQVVIVDGVLGEEEVENVLSIASALGVDDARAVLMLADLVKEEPELQIEL